jgi:4'-phosphopantetheinyl transferase
MIEHSKWRSRPFQLSMPREHVHVWRVSTDCQRCEVHHFRSLLNQNEVQHADQFRCEDHRRQFTVMRGFLRALLSEYLELPANELEIECDKYGKPGLPRHLNKKNLQFNVSHSHGHGLVALSCDAQIGVDLEFERKDPEFILLASTVLSDIQFAEFIKIPAAEQANSFYRMWTRKEAVSKAIGMGLSMPFQCFDVSFQARETPQIGQMDSRWGQADQWSLHDIDVAPEFSAALAINRRGRKVFFLKDGFIDPAGSERSFRAAMQRQSSRPGENGRPPVALSVD